MAHSWGTLACLNSGIALKGAVISTKGRELKHGSCHSEGKEAWCRIASQWRWQRLGEGSAGLCHQQLATRTEGAVTVPFLFSTLPVLSLTAQVPPLANRVQVTPSSQVCFARSWGIFVHPYLLSRTIACHPKCGHP